jgi:ABC-2 type transport system permease protein
MDIRKVWYIALRSVRETLGNRNLLLIMIAAPLAITAVIGLAFGGLSSGDINISTIEMGVVNNDQGANMGFTSMNFGSLLTDILTKPTDPTLQKLIHAQVLPEAEARKMVDEGKLAAVLIIPADFSSALNPANDKMGQTKLTLYRDAGSPISASVVSSVVGQIANTLAAGNITLFTAKDINPLLMVQAQTIVTEIGDQLRSAAPVSIDEQSITGAPSVTTNPLQYFAPAMAIFFVLFTGTNGAASIFEDKENGTLQRLLVTPNSTLTLMAGRFLGTYLSGLFQLGILIVAMPILGRIIGTKTSVWGNNMLGVILLAMAVSAAATGFGTMIAGLSRDKNQANVLASIVPMLFGMMGGAFFDLSGAGPIFNSLAKLTLNYWGTKGFSQLAVTNDLGSVLPNIAILLGMFVVFFLIGVRGFAHHLNEDGGSAAIPAKAGA